MPARYRPGSGGSPDEPAGRTWRLLIRYRILIIALQALIPGAATLFLWVPLTSHQYLPVLLTWALLAGTTMAWLRLAGRTWHESATLTPDMLIVRTVFRSFRIPLAEVTGVRFRRQAALMISLDGRPPPGSGRPAGRHAGRQSAVPAIKLGTAYWSGRRTAADDVADAIAVAAGLPPLPPREELVSRRQVWIRLPMAVAFFVLAGVVGQGTAVPGLIPSVAQLAAKGLALAAATLLVPAGLATFDRFFGLWRDRDAGHPGQAPEIS
jgi:hypothetical protein